MSKCRIHLISLIKISEHAKIFIYLNMVLLLDSVNSFYEVSQGILCIILELYAQLMVLARLVQLNMVDINLITLLECQMSDNWYFTHLQSQCNIQFYQLMFLNNTQKKQIQCNLWHYLPPDSELSQVLKEDQQNAKMTSRVGLDQHTVGETVDRLFFLSGGPIIKPLSTRVEPSQFVRANGGS